MQGSEKRKVTQIEELWEVARKNVNLKKLNGSLMEDSVLICVDCGAKIEKDPWSGCTSCEQCGGKECSDHG